MYRHCTDAFYTIYMRSKTPEFRMALLTFHMIRVWSSPQDKYRLAQVFAPRSTPNGRWCRMFVPCSSHVVNRPCQNECKGTGWDMNHSIVARQFQVARNGQRVLVRLRCIVVPCWIHPSVDDWQCSIWTLVLTVLRQVFCHIHRWHVCMIPRRSSKWFAFGRWRDQWFLWIGRNVLCHHN